MKAVIFALIVLLGVDIFHYHSGHLHALGDNLAGIGHEFGSWMYQ
ncbi:hypothetical protein [Sphingomonas sp.]